MVEMDMRVWSENEIAYLKEHYPLEGGKCAEKLGRSYPSVNHKACRLEIKNERLEWTVEEDEILHKLYGMEGAEGLSGLINHSKGAIIARASKLGIKYGDRWTDHEVECLKRGIEEIDMDRLSRELGKTKSEICGKLKNMGYSVTKAEIVWVKRDMDKFLDSELGYLAGFTDGEGTITLSGNGNMGVSPGFHLVNTNPNYFEWLSPKISLLSINTREEMGKNHKKKYITSLQGLKVLPLLEAIMPYLVLKKPQATLVVQFIYSRLSKPRRRYTKEERQIIENVAKLNLRGKSEDNDLTEDKKDLWMGVKEPKNRW